ncbi:hypothetical protein AMK59_3750 [Oryctes borbonicus]|uniref:Polyprenyl synthetase n=1 Tax=Oryctes borbonicus TaxID=1629725 RepID=A0A0T6B5L5_9SCAR|nr:hypothetical protein AMK59_3750 [Oryctes borbonicus]
MYSLRRTWHRAITLQSYSTYASGNPKLEEQTWSTSISEAEKVVGYPTSFLNLRWLLSDEVANIASHLRKLLGTNHPLLSIAKDLILNSEKPSWGLLVLLVSKAGGHNKTFLDIDTDVTAGVLHSQRILGEISEMIKTSHLLHQGLISIEDDTKNVSNMLFGNKLALLSGDYLLSNSFNQLASIKHHGLNELISSTLRDLTESTFINPRDKDNKALPSKPNPQLEEINVPDELGMTFSDFSNLLGNAKTEWLLRSTLDGASLLGKSCKGVLMLAGHEEDFQMTGYILGRYLALTLKATRDYNSIFKDGDISLVSAPVLFYLQQHPSFYSEIERMIDKDYEIVYDDLRNKLQQSAAVNETILLQNQFDPGCLTIISKRM